MKHVLAGSSSQHWNQPLHKGQFFIVFALELGLTEQWVIFEQHIRLKPESCVSNLDQNYAVIQLKTDGYNNNKYLASGQEA